ncbi:DUF3108 domain-containing protein [Psychromonas ossibalaenae]|uniref:DUF3108 domain-containing protein n=1 Tax=Psychromonas ossibalaenae TaxID=444922 RepID=UPI000365DD7E|nr:DUF3108 domain-containing protein [Psychromonas ossibalaenae]
MDSKYLFFFSILWILNPQYLSAQENLGLADSEQRYVYDVSYKSINVGQIIRELSPQGADMRVNTSAELAFLFFSFGGNQLSDIYRDKDSQLFLSRHFVRNNVGFIRVSMTADFSQNGHKSRLLVDGEKKEFVNETDKIVDFNALGLQLSEGLKAGQTHFEFYMQTSDSVAHYFFEVKGSESIDSKFGRLQTFRLEQTQKDDRKLTAWFAPDINYQMVKFHYQRNMLDIRGELSEHSAKKL